MIKRVYKIGLKQNEEEIYREGTYIERDIWREDINEKEIYIEKR